MKTTVCLSIRVYFGTPLCDANVLPISLFVLIPSVRINEIVACVVRRININALDPVAIRDEQAFQDFEILSLNNGVSLGKLWIHRALVIVLQSCERRREGVAFRIGFPKPAEVKALRLRRQIGIDEAFQLVRIESPVVGKQIRHKRSELFQTFLVHIRRGRHSIHNGLVHNLFSSFSERHSRSSLRNSSLGGSSSL